MKQIIYKSLFVLCFLMASIINVKAQEPIPATFVKINPELNGFIPAQMSDNGRYIVCNNGIATLKNTAKLWDTETDMVTEIGTKCWAHDVSNDGKIIVGQFADGSILYPGIYKDGKWNKAELYPGFGVKEGSQGGNIHSVSPDGKIFGGHLSYMKGPNIKPVVWNENGKYVRCFDIANVENYNDYRASMRAMSNDGTKAAGWSERVGDNYFNGYWIPSFWNKLEGDPIPVIVANGYLAGMDNNGTIAVGHTGQVGVVVKDDGTIIQMGSDFMDVSETGLIVGMDIYTEKLGLMTLDFFFNEMYGLEIEDMHFVQAVSDNGEFMAIRLMGGIAYVRVSGDPLPNRSTPFVFG